MQSCSSSLNRVSNLELSDNLMHWLPWKNVQYKWIYMFELQTYQTRSSIALSLLSQSLTQVLSDVLGNQIRPWRRRAQGGFTPSFSPLLRLPNISPSKSFARPRIQGAVTYISGRPANVGYTLKANTGEELNSVSIGKVFVECRRGW